jgi:uncharacterized membrane protein YoaK (UPF0700 family)
MSNLNAPTKITALIAVIVFLIGIIGSFVAVPYVSEYAFWFVSAAFVVLLFGVLFKKI